MPRASRVSGTPAGAITRTRSPGTKAGGRTTARVPARAGVADATVPATADAAMKVRREILTRRTLPRYTHTVKTIPGERGDHRRNLFLTLPGARMATARNG
ncbi:hypothetical protein Ato02nite_025530 [Paractinoplanes toevensis]|uniref:Uncharacterized protein n=1 Tax=Paractinoplanes toevensis TaxID=571911 RepID=A0A919TA99_9ACTN|nr:hypothetical protein Ato02nite_025530 [Actinoplanes toevensis]